MTALKDLRCRALPATALAEAATREHLDQLGGWTLRDGAIEKRFSFPDFHHTMAFVNALAWIAHVEDHHPDLSVGYGQCTVRFRTHAVDGLSLKDFACAAKVDGLNP